MSYFPDEWNDEDRMRVLLSPMPADEVSKKSRITFWSSAIHNWCTHTNTFSFNIKDVCSAFTKGTVTPKCIDAVILHMLQSNELCDINDLCQLTQENQSWTRWGFQVLIANPSRWAFKNVKNYLVNNKIENIQLVNIKLLQDKSNEVYSHYWQYKDAKLNESDYAITMLQLFQLMSDIVGTVDNLQIICHHLAAQNKLKSMIHDNNTVIKMSTPGCTKPPEISESDVANLHLSESIKKLEGQINSLNLSIEALQLEAKQAVKNGLKKQGLSALRRKKNNENAIIKLTGMLENLTACQLRLQEANINSDVIKTFKISVSALRKTFSGTLQGDEVASTMDDIQELLEECEDVSNMISKGVDSTNEDEDLEELEQLLQQDLHINTTNEDMSFSKLPDVPNNVPDILSPEKQNMENNKDNTARISL